MRKACGVSFLCCASGVGGARAGASIETKIRVSKSSTVVPLYWELKRVRLWLRLRGSTPK